MPFQTGGSYIQFELLLNAQIKHFNLIIIERGYLCEDCSTMKVFLLN